MVIKYNDIVIQNINAHNKIASLYDSRHEEIFNPTEQKRLSKVVREAYNCIDTSPKRKLILDFGAGTGNLTRHLIELDASIVAADVSQKCLEVIESKFEFADGLITLELNGTNLAEFEDNIFDMIATYSVLHHVPDYLGIVDEFIRILKPGGILYIDHEVCSSYWKYDSKYIDYLSELDATFYSNHLYELGITKNIIGITFGIQWLMKLIFVLKLYSYKCVPKDAIIGEDGDIHTFLYDHIEWDKIKAGCEFNCTVLAESDYLVCREIADRPGVWNRWANTVVDMKYMIFRKL